MIQIQNTNSTLVAFGKVPNQASAETNNVGEAAVDASLDGDQLRFRQAHDQCQQWLDLKQKPLQVRRNLQLTVDTVFSGNAADNLREPISNAKMRALDDVLDAFKLSNVLDRSREEACQTKLQKLLFPYVPPDSASVLPTADNIVSAGAPIEGGAAARTGQSLGEIWEELAGLVGKQKTENLDQYASALDRYTAMYKEVTNIISGLGIWVEAKGENMMKVNFQEIRSALNKILDGYNPPGPDKLIAGPNLTSDEADAICKKLGLDPAQCSYRNADGTFSVIPDLSQVKTILEKLPGDKNSNAYEMSIAQYNAWKAGFDAQTNRIEDALQARGQKYSNQFSRFENYHKTISSIIQAMADMLAKYLQF